ncbi:MAG: 30S ribosomal protein S6 [Patescibacteria group bacterium]|nr:30S ribosomal protein S6 [Patescibacteria group bacterium]
MAKKDAEMNEELMLEDSASPRVYELGFHIDPELPQEEVKKVYQGIRSIIAGNGAIVAEGEPEQIRLAYTVSRQEHAGRRDFDSAQFAWIAYEAAGEGHAAIVDAARTETRIFRHLDILTTKDAVRHAAEVREMREKAPEKPEEVSDTELDAALESAAV